jgi:hypothetical protein
LILQNDHRFKEDPEFGKMLTDMWFDDLSVEQKQELNKRVVMDKRRLPKSLEDDCFYACPTNVHRNIIHANNFRKHNPSNPQVSTQWTIAAIVRYSTQHVAHISHSTAKQNTHPTTQ